MAWFRHTMTVGELMSIDDARISRSTRLTVNFKGVENILKKENFLDKIFRIFRRGPKNILYRMIRYEVKSDSGNTYTVLIKLPPGINTQQFLRNKIQVFCTCSDFMYRAAYELNKAENLVNIPATREHLGIALTQAPTYVKTTPICKHVYACIQDLKKRIKDLNLIY